MHFFRIFIYHILRFKMCRAALQASLLNNAKPNKQTNKLSAIVLNNANKQTNKLSVILLNNAKNQQANKQTN